MAMTTSLIETAMSYNAANPDQSQSDAANRLAQAIIDTVKSATILYTVGLASPSGAVTGTFGNTIS